MSTRYAKIEEELATRGVFYATTVGDSMAPLFHTHEKVVRYKPVTCRLSRWDVPLVKREDGHYVLHRIVKVLPGGYITRGDNRRKCDPFVPEEQVVAVMDGYYEGETFVSVTDPDYLAYVAKYAKPGLRRYARLTANAFKRRLRRNSPPKKSR